MKSDQSLRNISLAAARRSIRKPFESRFTTVFETDLMVEIGSLVFFLQPAEEDELPICQTFIDNNNWTLVTTRKITTCKQGAQSSLRVAELAEINWGDFKGIRKEAYILGYAMSKSNQKVDFFIETGRISMFMVSVTRVLRQLA